MAVEEVVTFTGYGRRTVPWMFSGVAALVTAGILIATLLSRPSKNVSIADLADAASDDARAIEARLSGGFRWAPYRAPTRDGAAESTLTNTRGGGDSPSPHTSAIVRLLTGKPRDAFEDLSAAAGAANDARVWSDLSAAAFETAVRHDAPELLADALTAADRALALDSRLAEALFNRALVIERLGLRDDAREAWERYLGVDPSSAWAMEVRERAAKLVPHTPFVDAIEREYARFARDPSGVQALARRDPQGARGWGAMEVLGRWAEATIEGRTSEADTVLRVARELANVIVATNGDRMLDRAVGAIENADDASHKLLASAHVDFRDGLRAFQAGRPGDGEVKLRRAVASFARAPSPMELSALYYAANTAFEQGRKQQAQLEIEALLRRAPGDSPAYRAQLLWQLGNCHTSRAEWGAAMALLGESAAEFERLGEHHYASAVRRLIAFIYDRIGDADAAWKQRMIALRGLGVRPSIPLEKTVASIADAAMIAQKWHTASSFLSLQVDLSQRMRDDVQLANALMLRAAVRSRLGDRSGAMDDLAAADEATARVKDTAYRDFFRVARMRVRAMLTESSDEAVSLLSEAIDFQAAKSDRLNLPGLFLQRGRARRAAGDADGAAADFERGIAELELHRSSLPEGETRWGAFHAAAELFDEAIDLAIATGDVTKAFQTSERARARALLESHGGAPPFDAARLADGTVLVEYAALPSRLVIFAADRNGIRAVSAEIKRETLTTEIVTLTRALRGDEHAVAIRTAKSLHRRLVQPVATLLGGTARIVFVPDATTAIVPFSALVDDRGAYLIEQHEVVIAPSAAVLLNAPKHRRMAPPRTVVIVSSSALAAGGERLAAVDAEVDNVARAYARSVRVQGETTQFDELAKHLADAEAIHFAGHAVGDDSGLEPASILLRENGKERRVSVSEIAKLRLTKTSVVVLAGCSTARGERRAAEGVISIAHGFLIAGAPSVVATLWPIEDAAASRLFPRLHRRLADGIAPAEALRQVQLESIQRGDVPASLWTALQNIGN